MKALILAAARSEKLTPFTDTLPKSMIPIAGDPILCTILNQLHEAGVNEVWIVVNYLQKAIKDYFHYGKDLDMKIEYLEQKEESGIGKAISLFELGLAEDENFLLVYGDTLMTGNHFKHLLKKQKHAPKSTLATICHPVSKGDYGNIYLGHDMKISKLLEKPEGTRMSNYIFGGSFIFHRSCFQNIKALNYNVVSYFQLLIQEGKLDAALWEDNWIDISYPWHILAANQMMMSHWQKSIIPASVTIEPNVNIIGPVFISENVHISTGTTIKGPCYIGPNVYIGNSALIRKNAAIGINSKIGFGTEIKNAVLFGNSTVGRLSFIGDSVIGKNVQLGSSTITVNYLTSGKSIYFNSQTEGQLNTELSKLGAFIGDQSSVGTGHTIAPGTTLNAKTEIVDLITIQNQSESK
jgi:UDP-N-acetylglucosamine diphosphorylase / glucose-1-phosphate thymidylyltransferase / UDP-N-acetylgalactosamine diphosphorylase / glucosamine-1-phosphate N-acetyltransferase / galactosamine-1-phosphate N-acetyltransferase